MPSAITFLLFDGLNLIRRVFAAVPEHQQTDPDTVVTSVERSVRRGIQEVGATHGLCAMDVPGGGWRTALHPPYKSKRPPMPQALVDVLPAIEARLETIGLPRVREAGAEADDIVASIAAAFTARPGAVNGELVVMSTDKALLSLLELGVRVRHHFERTYLDANYVEERFGIRAHQLLDWLAIVGDTSQDIPGVKGIGAKSATRLLNDFGSLEAILSANGDGLSAREKSAFETHAESARLSRQLVTPRTDIVIGVNLRDCRL